MIYNTCNTTCLAYTLINSEKSRITRDIVLPVYRRVKDYRNPSAVLYVSVLLVLRPRDLQPARKRRFRTPYVSIIVSLTFSLHRDPYYI